MGSGAAHRNYLLATVSIGPGYWLAARRTCEKKSRHFPGRWQCIGRLDVVFGGGPGQCEECFTMRRRDVLAGLAAAACDLSRAAAFPSRNLIVRGNRLFLDVAVNGVPVRALLDSAAESSFADAGFARRIGLIAGEKVQARGSGGDTDAFLAKGVAINVLGLTLKPDAVAVLDLSGVSRHIGAPVDFVLGREIFDAARLAIDIEGGTIAIAPRGREPKGIRLPLKTERGIETFPASVEGLSPVATAFDLGNGTDVLIGSGYVKRAGLLGRGRPVTKTRGAGIGGQVLRDTIMLRSLAFGGRRFENVTAAIDATDSATDLNVGVALLRQFQIVVDFSQRFLWLDSRGRQ
jgi:Aspartyl protease